MGVKYNPFAGNLDIVDSPSGDFTDLDVSGDITLDDGGTYTTTVQTVTPTANRTISFPDATGTVALVAGSSGQVTYNNAGALAGFNGLTIDGSGNLSGGGVGTTSPAVAWDVVGQVRASTGILFGTDTAAANALDDYEEGVFTVTMTPNTSGTISLYSTANALSYTKIGSFVYVTGRIEVQSVATPVGTRVSVPLPFQAKASVSDQEYRTGGTIQEDVLGFANSSYQFEVNASATNLIVIIDASTIAANDGYRFNFGYTAA